jgi:hypothetical protein
VSHLPGRGRNARLPPRDVCPVQGEAIRVPRSRSSMPLLTCAQRRTFAMYPLDPMYTHHQPMPRGDRRLVMWAEALGLSTQSFDRPPKRYVSVVKVKQRLEQQHKRNRKQKTAKRRGIDTRNCTELRLETRKPQAAPPGHLGRIWRSEATRLEDPLIYPTACGHQNQVGNAMAYRYSVCSDSTSFVR